MMWWAWFLFGFALLIVELSLPTGFIIFLFGCSAIVVGMLGLLSIVMPVWAQWISFGVISIILLAFARQKIASTLKLSGKKDSSDIVGQQVRLTSDVAPGGTGQGELRGTTWTIKNRGPSQRKVGEMCEVVSVDGLALEIK